MTHVNFQGKAKPKKNKKVKMTVFLESETVEQVRTLAGSRTERRSLSNMLACLVERQIELERRSEPEPP